MSEHDTLDRRRLAWAVVVTGLPWRFTRGAHPGSALEAGNLFRPGEPEPYQRPVDVDAVLSVGPRSAHIDDLKAVAEQEPVEVRILARGARTSSGAIVHPIHVLGRVGGPASAEHAVRLAVSLPHTPPAGAGLVDLEMLESCSGWTLPGPVHIGQEVIWADHAETAGGRHYLRDCFRGADRWATQEHPVSPRDYEEPWVTSEVTTWRGRWAQIWCSALGDDGAPLQWVPYWQGVLDSAPACKGDVITLSVAPYTAVMGYRIGVGSAARTARTIPGWHRIVAGYCDWIVSRELQRASVWFYDLEDAQSADGGTWLQFSVADWQTVEALYFQSMPTAEWSVGGGYSQMPSGADIPNRKLLFDWNGGDNLPAEYLSAAAVEVGIGVRRYEHATLGLLSGLPADSVVAWPDRLAEVWNTPQAQPSASCLADPANGGIGRMARIRLLPDTGSAVATVADLDTAFGAQTNGADIRHWRCGFQLDSDSERCAWAGIVGDPSVTADAGVGQPREGQAPARPGSGVGWRQIGDVIEARSEQGDTAQELPLGGVPTWWLGRGEQWVGPLDTDIWSGGTQEVLFTGAGLPEAGVRVLVTGSEAVVLPDGTTGYFLAVSQAKENPELRAFGSTPLTAQVVATSTDTEPGVYLLRLLESGIGDGANGLADVLPIGANLPSLAIDRESFLRAGAPGPLMGQDYTAVRGQTIEEQTEGLLLACGVKVAQVYSEDAGRWRIALVHLGAVSGLGSAQTITDAEMIVGDDGVLVETVPDGRTVKSYEISVNHTSPGGPVKIPVACATERNDAGADSGKPLELDLPGVVIADGTGSLAQAAVEIVADARANVGQPRVRWRFSVSATRSGAGARAIGDTVTVTSSQAVPLRPTETVAGVPCRIVGVEADPFEADRLDLEVRPYPGRAGGWAPALRVASVVTDLKVTVEEDVFSDADIAYFAAGDAVDCVPLGGWSSRVATTLHSIVGSTVTTESAHGLAPGDVIRLRGYAAAVAIRSSLAGYAWLADDEGLLPGGAGQVIA